MSAIEPDKEMAYYVDGKPNEDFKKPSLTRDEINGMAYYVDGAPPESIFIPSTNQKKGNFFLVFN